MSNLTDVYNQLSAADAVYLEKHAAQVKIAEEEDAAGRIMARGFADELTKLAAGAPPVAQPPKQVVPPKQPRVQAGPAPSNETRPNRGASPATAAIKQAPIKPQGGNVAGMMSGLKSPYSPG